MIQKSDDLAVEDRFLTMTKEGWRSVISNKPLPGNGTFKFEIRFVDISTIKSSWYDLSFGISSKLAPLSDGDTNKESAILFCAHPSTRQGWIYHNGKSESDFLSK